MKSGLTLQQLAEQLEAAKKAQRDFVAPAPLLRAAVNPAQTVQLAMKTNGHDETFNVRPYAHGQLAQLTGIPKAYYDRMATEAPNLLADSLNTWLRMRTDDRQLVRVAGRDVRAILSDRYRPLDNVNLAEVALPELLNRGATIESCQITETKLYIKAVLPTLSRTINGSEMRDLATYEQVPDHAARVAENQRRGFKVGDVVQAMVCLSNSEVGAGTLRVEGGVYRLVCLNAAISPDGSYRKYHIGRGLGGDAEDAVRALLTDETRRADDKALWLKVRDVVRAAFDEQRFNTQCDKLEAATQDKIALDKGVSLERVVERVVEKFSIGEATGGSILKHLIAGGDLSRYGVVQAVTRASAEVEDYDNATELERVGGNIVELSREDWRQLAA